MSCFNAQMVALKREMIISNSMDVDPLDFPVLEDSTKNLILRAYSLSFSPIQETEIALYEIYYTLLKRIPKFVIEVNHPVFFRGKLQAIKYNKFLWTLLNEN
jgi:hypothetical protein